MIWSKLALGVSGLMLLGCAGGNPAATATSPRWLVTQTQLLETGARTALDAMDVLQPGFRLRLGQLGEPAASRPAVTVYVDGVLQVGGIDALRRMPVRWVESIRMISVSNARFPVGRGGGLLVTTVSGDGPRQ